MKKLSGTRQTCENCWFHRAGHCMMYSSECATSVSRHMTNPPRWMSYEEGKISEGRLLQWEMNRQSTIAPSAKHLVNAE